MYAVAAGARFGGTTATARYADRLTEAETSTGQHMRHRNAAAYARVSPGRRCRYPTVRRHR